MQYSQLIKIVAETGLSPEQIAKEFGISGMTYRRWLKCRPDDLVPAEYNRNIAGGIYQLLTKGKLDHNSKTVQIFLKDNLPEFFQAAISQFDLPAEGLKDQKDHQDKVARTLWQIGNSDTVRKKINNSGSEIKKFAKWGSGWRNRITLLAGVIKSKKLNLIDKLVAYGALFYLVTPFDLIPDSIPIFGYVDDFGILGFAVSYYCKKYPAMFRNSNA